MKHTTKPNSPEKSFFLHELRVPQYADLHICIAILERRLLFLAASFYIMLFVDWIGAEFQL